MAVARNDPCPCGSGKRYKHCHGAGADTGVPAPAQPATANAAAAAAPRAAPSTRMAALAAQRAGELGHAETLYRQALAENPDDVDVMHMLGVVLYERMRPADALALLFAAAERTRWSVDSIRHNVGLALGRLTSADANRRQNDLVEAYVAHERERMARDPGPVPRVAAIVVVRGDAPFVVQALASVAAQAHAPDEVVVVEHGLAPTARARLDAALAGAPFAARRVVVAADATRAGALNAGIAASTAAWIAPLDADDTWRAGWLETMLGQAAQRGARWGYALVADIDAHGAPADASGNVPPLAERQRSALGARPAGFSLLELDVVGTPSNLVVERALFARAGGYDEADPRAEWSLAEHLADLAEPAQVRAVLVQRRVHGGADPAEPSAAEVRHRLGLLGRAILVDARTVPNPLSPRHPVNAPLAVRLIVSGGFAELLPPPALRALANEVLAARADAGADARPVPGAESARDAIAVLGMHRSGTSALSRVLNLAGAFLPIRVKPAKLGVNPKGFWEPEAVLDLDERMLASLGGTWYQTNFELPAEGPLVDDFVADVGEVLATEFEQRPLIAFKDPRLCLLAPLWDRALRQNGYRPHYVVPVRDPLAVARSLHARGGISVADGLRLWADYVERVEAFTAGSADAVYVHYDDLLRDWRGVVRQVAAVLDLPLDAETHAGAIDDFLEADLRHQHGSAADIDAELPPADAARVHGVYARMLALCERDRTAPATRVTTIAAAAPRPGEPLPSATFALCIEDNAIRDQALLLCESVRTFGGRYRDAPIIAYSPRPALRVDAATRARLRELNVDYVDEPLNVECPEYAPVNRIVAGAHAERHATTDFIVAVDSDTVWLAEPELPAHADVAARVVDMKGSATRGPGDRYEAYWEQVAALAGVPLSALPWVRATIGGDRIRASYNAGLTVVRRDRGIYALNESLFFASARAALRPHAGSGIDIRASTGQVGKAGSEYWGSSQTTLTFAIWTRAAAVVHYPDWYNVPLHLIAAEAQADARWRARPPVHLHYHWMFDAEHRGRAFEVLAELGMPDDQRAWLARRTPLGVPRAR
ncbi:MAG: glycosyltransferase [Proteobacteria bacterium]|nr:glycosyltransferase [Pseudomonadota bacterium]